MLEDYDEEVPDTMISSIESEERDNQRQETGAIKKINAVSSAKAKNLPSKSQISAKPEEALQQRWTGGIGRFLLVAAESTDQSVCLTFPNSLSEFVPRPRSCQRDSEKHHPLFTDGWEDCGIGAINRSTASSIPYNVQPARGGKWQTRNRSVGDRLEDLAMAELDVTDSVSWNGHLGHITLQSLPRKYSNEDKSSNITTMTVVIRDEPTGVLGFFQSKPELMVYTFKCEHISVGIHFPHRPYPVVYHEEQYFAVQNRSAKTPIASRSLILHA